MVSGQKRETLFSHEKPMKCFMKPVFKPLVRNAKTTFHDTKSCLYLMKRINPWFEPDFDGPLDPLWTPYEPLLYFTTILY